MGADVLRSKVFYSSYVTHLRLKSFHPVGKGKILLANGMSVPVFPALEELQIKKEKGTELNTYQVLGLFAYTRKCKRLKKLSFIDCVLPLVFPVNSLSKRLLEIEVSWNPPKHGFRLDSTTGKWILSTNEATILETKGQHSLRLLCSSDVFLEGTDSRQLQMARILLLEIASSLKIPVSCVDLDNCSPRADGSGLNLILKSGLSLSILSSLQKLRITDNNRRLTNKELVDILHYSYRCTSLKELEFVSYDLSDTIRDRLILKSLEVREVKVWNDHLSFPYFRFLNLWTGEWEIQYYISLRLLHSKTVYIRGTDRNRLQRSTIRHLEVASTCNFPIFCVWLRYCSPRVDESGLNLILESGLSLSILSSLQKLRIYDGNRRLTNEEWEAILSYSSHCTSLKELRFVMYDLPDNIPVGSIPPSLNSRNVKVWNVSASSRRLDLQTGGWQACDYKGDLPGEEVRETYLC
ncbi:uncharacterized protein [Apostichopus japonicus]|uniref:uncharacterized protein n=1 Tax=Stichopus japonicus TaxID=307972 RepID=UPI003AB40B19